MKPIKIEVKDLEIDLQNHTVSEKLIPWPKGEDWKDGETPTEEQLLALILPNIPKPKNGKDGKSITKTEVKEIIKSVLPEDKLIEKIVKKIPVPKDGEDGKSFRFADLTAYEKQILTWPPWSTGVWVPRYGTTGQVLAKKSSKDFDTEWVTGWGGGGAVDSVNWQTGVVVLDADDIDETASRIWFTTAEETKLGGIETWAEVNTIDTVSDTTEIDLAITARDLTATIRSGSIDETKLDTSVNASLDLADTAVQPAGLSGYELLANKATDFTTINNTLYPTVQAVNTAINTAVTGLLDYRGSYDASTNLFPATGGSGILGAILSGDFWICSVPGTLWGTPVTNGDLIIAIVDTPWQTAGNWDLIENTLGYTPENVANKENTTIDTNTTKYPTVNLLKTGLDTKQATLVSGTNIKTVNSTTLLGSGDLAVATTAQWALADSALQPWDIASGTITARADDINFSGGIDGDVLTVQADGSLALEAAAAGGANVALSNLSGVAINTSLISDTNNTDDIGSTGVRWKKWWFVDMEVTNPIAGSITGNAATVTTNANLTWPVTSTGNATAIANWAISNAMLANSAVANLSGTNTGDQTSVSGNAWTATTLQTARTIGTATGDVTSAGSSFDGSANNTNALTIANSAVTLAKMASGTAWNLITYDASGNPAAVATGTSGQVLTSNGAGLPPTMQTPAWGWNPWWDFVSYSTASAASSITVSSLNLNTDWGMYQVIVKAEWSTVCDYNMQFNAETGGYAWWLTRNSFNGSAWTMNSSANNTGTDTWVFLAGSASDVKSLSAVIYLSEVLKFDGTSTQIVADYSAIGTGTSGSNDAFEKNVGSGITTNIEANITSIKFLASVGTQNWKVWVFKAAVS